MPGSFKSHQQGLKGFLVSLFVAIFLVFPILFFSQTSFEREKSARSAGESFGTAFIWPDSSVAANPIEAMQILSDAADSTESNIVRTFTRLVEGGRSEIYYYVYQANSTTKLYNSFSLRTGRWPRAEEVRAGSASVSSLEERDVVGVPQIFGNSYDLTFTSLSLAFDSLPVAGEYRIEAVSSSAAESFLRIIQQRLSDLGAPTVHLNDASHPPQIPYSASTGWVFEYAFWILLSAIISLSVALTIREKKAIGVLALLGFSFWRMVFHLLWRPIFIALILGIGISAWLVLTTSGMDFTFVSSLFLVLLAVILFAIVSGFFAIISVVWCLKPSSLIN